MNTYDECMKCKREMRRFKNSEMRKRRRELSLLILAMIILSGYLIWQVSKIEPEVGQAIKPVYIEIEKGPKQISAEVDGGGLERGRGALSYVSRGLPRRADGQFKTYMDYRTITNKSSRQWNLQQLAYTDEEGFRRFNDNYLVAVGTYYADKVGKEFRVTLDSGVIFYAMVGDVKQDIHTDPNNQYIEHNGNIIEFIVDVDKLDPLSKKLGNVSNSGLPGAVVKIEEVVR